MIRSHGVRFFRTCIVCLLQRYWLFTKKLCYLLFSISVAIGQFFSNWPGWSSRTVNVCQNLLPLPRRKLLKQLLFLAVLGRKCYVCVSKDSMSDCKGKMESHDCSVLGPSYDQCASMHVDVDAGGIKFESYVKSCFTKSDCESGNDAFKQCKNVDGATCELNCCDSDNCNGGTVAAVSVTLMVTCALMALFR